MTDGHAQGAWEPVAERWAAFARSGDEPYKWNAPEFLRLLPAPGGLTLDVACGEGRLTRRLAALGYNVLGCDSSATLIRLAQDADPEGNYRVGDAAALPVGDGEATTVVIFMALHSIEDHRGALIESRRVLAPGGALCVAMHHPVSTAGEFEGETPDERFVVHDYCNPHAVEQPLFDAWVTHHHRPIDEYFAALTDARFVVEALRELPTQRRSAGRIPTLLHLRAVAR